MSEQIAPLSAEQEANFRALVLERNELFVGSVVNGNYQQNVKEIAEKTDRIADYADRLFATLDAECARADALQRQLDETRTALDKEIAVEMEANRRANVAEAERDEARRDMELLELSTRWHDVSDIRTTDALDAIDLALFPALPPNPDGLSYSLSASVIVDVDGEYQIANFVSHNRSNARYKWSCNESMMGGGVRRWCSVPEWQEVSNAE